MAAGGASGLIPLQDIVEDWAWDRFQRNRTRKQKRMKKENLSINVCWDRCSFLQGDPKFNDEHTITIPNAQTLFKTTFNNNTGESQDYSFQASRSSRSQASVSITDGFTLGQEMGVKLSVPGNVVEANAGFKTEMSLTKEKAQSFEEELSWGVDSQVKVKAHQSTLAEVKITESKYSSNFTIESMLSGKVCVSFHNRKKNNAFVKMIEGDISRIVQSMLKSEPNVFIENSGIVKIITKGECKFRFGCEQVVALKENPMN